MNLNKVFVAGNLTKNPELKMLPSGTPVCSFSIATNEFYKDKSGQNQQKTEYHNIVAFGKQAENINQYMRKGSQILIEGKLQTRSWDDKDGKKQYRTEILVTSMQFGSSPQSKKEESKEENYGNGVDSISEPDISYPEDEINPEDIPF